MTTFEATLRASAAGALASRLNRFVQVTGSAVALEVQSGGKYGPGTPVDTGFARANWTAALDGEPPEVSRTRINVPGAHAGEALASEEAIQALTATMAAGQTLALANRTEYIGDLEAGKSPQAPEGMVEPVARNFQRLADEVAAFVAREG